MTRTLIALALAAGVVACSTTSPDVVQPGDAQRLATVQDATVLSVRDVTVDGSQSGTGAVAGGVVGGALGSSHSHGAESVAIGVIGAVAGAVIGNTIERAATRESAVELLLQMPNGERRAIVQAKAGEAFQPGDRVVLVNTGGRVRVTKAPPGTTAASAPVPAKPEATYAPGGRP